MTNSIHYSRAELLGLRPHRPSFLEDSLHIIRIREPFLDHTRSGTLTGLGGKLTCLNGAPFAEVCFTSRKGFVESGGVIYHNGIYYLIMKNRHVDQPSLRSASLSLRFIIESSPLRCLVLKCSSLSDAAVGKMIFALREGLHNWDGTVLLFD